MVVPSVRLSVELLKEIKLFKTFTENELNLLLPKGVAVQYEAHSNVVIEGELSWGLYIILDGILGIMKTNKLTGQFYDVGQLHSGSFFGEMSLIDDNPRSATVKAQTNCQLLYFSKDVFNEFLTRSSELKLRFFDNCIKTLVYRLRELDDNYVVSQYQLWQTAMKKEGGAP